MDSFVRNKTVVNSTGIEIKGTGYSVFVSNINLDCLTFPTQVDINPHVVDGLNTVTITLNNLVVSLLADYKISVIGISDQGKATPVNVTLSQLVAEFNFGKDGQINFRQFEFDLGTFDIKLNSFIYKSLFWLFKSMIKGAIKKQETTIKAQLITMVKNFVTKPLLIDVGFGIGFNLTNTDRPQLNFFDVTNNFKNIMSGLKALTFLPKSNEESSRLTSTLVFGVHGSMYPNQDPSLKPHIAPAPKMKFNNVLDNSNDLNIVLSDYTLNTFLYMIQQSSFMRFTVHNDTSNPLPMTIDTQGLSQLLPELGSAFPANFPVNLLLYVDPVDNAQPLISSNLHGTHLKLNATIEFDVVNSTDPMDDPVQAVIASFEADLLIQTVTDQFYMQGRYLSIIIPKTEVLGVNVKSQIGNIQTDRFQKSLGSLLFIATKQIADKTKNIDVSGMIYNATGLNALNLDVDYNNDYIQASINIVRP